MIAENKYGKYYIDKSFIHRPCPKILLAGYVHEPKTIEYMINNATGPIIHSGSFFGDFFPALETANVPIYTFEPVKLNYECALKTIELNSLKNVVIKNVGLSDKKTKLKIMTKSNERDHIGGGAYVSEDGNEEIEVDTIDNLVKGRVSIIQLDIEGHELQALKGAKKTIKKWNPIIILEFLDFKIIEDYINFLKQFGYNRYKFLIDNHDENNKNLRLESYNIIFYKDTTKC